MVVAVLLGVAAMAIAWSTYQSALWGGIQDEAYTESVRGASEAVDQLQSADRVRALDELLFAQVRVSGVCEPGESADETACERVLDSMSEPGRAAVMIWSEGDPNPFETPAYLGDLYASGQAADTRSDEQFDEAGRANTNGDDHELAATIFTAVLFFAGVAAVVDDRRVGWALVGAAGIFLVAGLVYAVTLPLA